MLQTVTDLKKLGLMTDGFIDNSTTTNRQKILKQFRDFKLWIFSNVYMHLYFNSFRYDTERDFYDAISNVRGIQPRQKYWEDIVSKLQNTINDIDEQKRQDNNDKISNIIIAITVFSIFQVLFQATDVLNSILGDDLSGHDIIKKVWTPPIIPESYTYILNNYILINLTVLFIVLGFYMALKTKLNNIIKIIFNFKSRLSHIVFSNIHKK
jgi:uncharacterized membrane protein YqhA